MSRVMKAKNLGSALPRPPQTAASAEQGSYQRVGGGLMAGREHSVGNMISRSLYGFVMTGLLAWAILGDPAWLHWEWYGWGWVVLAGGNFLGFVAGCLFALVRA